MNAVSDKEVLFQIKAHRHIDNKDVMNGVIANLIGAGIRGQIENDFILKLTEDELNIETKGYSAWGGLLETTNIDKIALEDICFFDVKDSQEQEIIVIHLRDNSSMVFMRDNKSHDNLGRLMAELLSEKINRD